MGYSKEQRIVNSITGSTKKERNKKQKHSETGSFKIPNKSGDHYRSFKRDTPTIDMDLVNKKYVDDNKGMRAATLVVAASDSKDTTNADYVCDGTDDEVEINQAISDLPATGGRVLLMDGTFDIDSSISLNKSNVSLIGQGKSTILEADSTINIIDIVSNKDYCIINNLKIKGVTSYGCVGIKNQSNYNLIKNTYFDTIYEGIICTGDHTLTASCNFDDCTYGIYQNSGNIQVSNSSFYSCNHGIYILGQYSGCDGCYFDSCSEAVNLYYGYCGSCVFYDSDVNSNYGACVSGCIFVSSQLDMGRNSSAVGNLFNNCNQSVILGSYNSSFVGNTIFDEIGDSAITVNGSRHTISSNSLHDIDKNGIKLRGALNCIISNNNIRNCSTDGDDTYTVIMMEDAYGDYSTYNVVSGNRISSNDANKHKYGIREDSSDDDYNLISNNICTDAATENISVQGENTLSTDNMGYTNDYGEIATAGGEVTTLEGDVITLA